MNHPECVYILIPVHNRRTITLTCLKQLSQLGLIDRYHIVVIDDGSTDGTSQAIQQAYPSVHLIDGSGDLWWTGAIVVGMQYAIKQGAEYLLWLNDDTIPEPETIEQLVETCRSQPHLITSAQCYGDEQHSIPTYGAQFKRWLGIKLMATPTGINQPCDALSGNLVCFSSTVVDRIGYPNSRRVPHCQADIVYTYQAKQAGFQPIVVGDAIAVCEMNPMDTGWINSPVAMMRRWKMLNSPKSNLYPPAYWHYCQTFFGVFGILPFIQVYVRLAILTVLIWIVPKGWLKKMKAWKDQRL